MSDLEEYRDNKRNLPAEDGLENQKEDTEPKSSSGEEKQQKKKKLLNISKTTIFWSIGVSLLIVLIIYYLSKDHLFNKIVCPNCWG
jgi:hypothetical protein